MPLNEFIRGPVATIEPQASLIEAARKMVEHCVGALVVSRPTDFAPVGIVTDRDLVGLLAGGLDPKESTLADFAGPPLETVSVSEDLRVVTRKMRERGVRRLPIVGSEGALLGLISLDDLLIQIGREMADLAEAVESEIQRERSMVSARKRPPA